MVRKLVTVVVIAAGVAMAACNTVRGAATMSTRPPIARKMRFTAATAKVAISIRSPAGAIRRGFFCWRWSAA